MATTKDVEIPRPKRGEGQWGLGYFEPLTPAERIKRDELPLDVRKRIMTTYGEGGFRSIDPASLRSKFRWWGLYTQRKPGIPGGQTANVEPWELEDEFFMMRIRIEGGLLTSEQLRAIAWASERYGRDIADITDRQNVQLHWIRVEDVPAIWERLEAVGLTTCEACGDVPRTILGCPLAGVDKHEIFDASDVIRAAAPRLVGNPDYANLPRKYKTTISGCRHQCVQPEVNDVSFVGVEGPDGVPGFDLWVGGGLSTNPHFAQRTGAFVLPEQVPDVWEAVTATYRDFGYRRSRNRARMKFLVADWGAEKFREVMQAKYLGYELPNGPTPEPSDSSLRDHVGVFEQHDGRNYIGFASKAGRISGHQLRLIADMADKYGSGHIRTTTQQKMVITDIEAKETPGVVQLLESLDLLAEPSKFRKGMMACTGIEFCKLAITETKHRAQWLYQELDARIPGWDEEIHINVNGCPNACARFQIADIGLMGASLPRPDGTKSDGFLVNLGGGLGADKAFGRRVRGVRVFAEDLADYVEGLLTHYKARPDAQAFPSFGAFVNSLSDDELKVFGSPSNAMAAR